MSDPIEGQEKKVKSAIKIRSDKYSNTDYDDEPEFDNLAKIKLSPSISFTLPADHENSNILRQGSRHDHLRNSRTDNGIWDINTCLIALYIGSQIVTSILQIATIFTSVYIIYETFRLESGFFAYHPTCMTLAFVLLMPSSMMAFYQHHFITASYSIYIRFCYHWILMVISILLIGVGLIIALINNWTSIEPHQLNEHHVLGLIAVVFLVFPVSIAISFIFRGSLEIHDVMPGRVYRTHSTLGLIGYILGSANVIVGCRLFFNTYEADCVSVLVTFIILCLVIRQIYHFVAYLHTEY